MERDNTLSRDLRALWSLARTGWMLRGIPASLAETVAEHSFTSAIIALELALRARESGAELDPYKAAAYALVHDLGEAIIGDISRGAVDPEAKSSSEKDALERLSGDLMVAGIAAEQTAQETLEATIARVAELIATAHKGGIYRSLGYTLAWEVSENSLAEALELSKKAGILQPVLEVLELLGIRKTE